MSVPVTILLKTQNIILHFSHSKVLLHAYVTQIHWLSGQLLSSFLTKLHPHQLTCWPLNVTWILLLPWLAFSVPEQCREHYLCVSRLFLVQMRSCVGWSVVVSSAQQLYRNGRDCVEISPTGTYPFLTAKYSWFCSQAQPPPDYQLKNVSF